LAVAFVAGGRVAAPGLVAVGGLHVAAPGLVAVGGLHVAAPGLAAGAPAVAAAGGRAGALALAAVGAVVGFAVAHVPDGPDGLFPLEYAVLPRAVHVIARVTSSAAPTVAPGVVAPQAPPAL